MNNVDKQYLNLLSDILNNGYQKSDRTGTGTISTFGQHLVFDLQEGFPLLTTKRVWMKGVVHELLWFLNCVPEKYENFGNTNIKYLVDNDVQIWTEWPFQKYVKENKIDGKPNTPQWDLKMKEFIDNIKSSDSFAKAWGELGPVYGKQWISWNSGKTKINQIREIQEKLRSKPDDRRLIVSAWNVGEIEEALLPPCHYSFQFYSREFTFEERMDYWKRNSTNDEFDSRVISNNVLNKLGVPQRELSLLWNQRSTDTCAGLPFNIASYALLLEMMAQTTGHVPGKLHAFLGDTHIYLNHIEAANEQLKRDPFKLPILKLNKSVMDIFNFRYDHIKILDYQYHPPIKLIISV